MSALHTFALFHALLTLFSPRLGADNGVAAAIEEIEVRGGHGARPQDGWRLDRLGLAAQLAGVNAGENLFGHGHRIGRRR